MNATLISVTPEAPSDATGYIIAKGNKHDFSASEIQEMRQASALPFTWGALPQGDHYFRIATKDRFYDAARNALELNWSAVLVVTVFVTETSAANATDAQ